MIQLLTPFRADLHKLAGGAGLGEGIGRGLGHGLADLSAGISRAMEKKEREGKMSEQLTKLLETAYPDKADEVKTWSLSEKQGFLEGEAIKSAQRKESMAMQKLLGDLEEQQQMMAERTASARVPNRLMAGLEAASARRPGEFPLSNEAMESRVADRTGIGPGARRLIEAAAAEGAPLPPSLMDDLIRGGAGGPGAMEFREDPETGERFAIFGKSMASSGVNPSKARAKPTAPIQPRVVVGTDDFGQTRVTWTGSPEDFAKQFPGAKMPKPDGGTAAAAVEEAPLDMPKSKGELKKGKRYTTPRGVATWDGEKFTLVK